MPIYPLCALRGLRVPSRPYVWAAEQNLFAAPRPALSDRRARDAKELDLS